MSSHVLRPAQSCSIGISLKQSKREPETTATHAWRFLGYVGVGILIFRRNATSFFLRRLEYRTRTKIVVESCSNTYLVECFTPDTASVLISDRLRRLKNQARVCTRCLLCKSPLSALPDMMLLPAFPLKIRPDAVFCYILYAYVTYHAGLPKLPFHLRTHHAGVQNC